ncbi:MAG: hypothetical protein QOC56_2707 [Alphaproteobacteria bacterium]|nr:hypothetical protein [Alphaproteobacteria bacterium]
MWLLIVYVVLMILGDIADYLIGLFVERMWGQQASLVVFLVLYFLFLWISWILAVKITAPRSATARAPA